MAIKPSPHGWRMATGTAAAQGMRISNRKRRSTLRGELSPVGVCMVGEDRELLDGELLVDFRECSQAIANRGALDSHVEGNKVNIAAEGVATA
jgi:hypothetical protein